MSFIPKVLSNMISHQDLLDAKYNYRTLLNEYKEEYHLYTKNVTDENNFHLIVSIIEWSSGGPPESPNECSALVYGNDVCHWQYEFMLNNNHTIESLEDDYIKFYNLMVANYGLL